MSQAVHHHETMGDGQLLVNMDDQNMVTGSSNGSVKEKKMLRKAPYDYDNMDMFPKKHMFRLPIHVCWWNHVKSPFKVYGNLR